MTLESAIQMNNRACLSMSRGRDEQHVVLLLSQALGRLKASVKARMHCGEEGPSETDSSSGPPSCMMTGLVQGRSVPSSPLPPSSSSYSSSNSSATSSTPSQQRRRCPPSAVTVPVPMATGTAITVHHIFDKPIAIGLPKNGRTQDALDGINGENVAFPLYSACILLNMAIAHHRWAVRTTEQSSSSRTYMKAERLYTIALQTIGTMSSSSEGGKGRQKTNTTSAALRIIALNNLADVHRRRGHIDASNVVITHLSHLLSHHRRDVLTGKKPQFVTVANDGMNGTDDDDEEEQDDSMMLLLSRSDLDAMTLNVMLWMDSPQLAPAA